MNTPFRRFLLVLIVALAVVFVPWGIGIEISQVFSMKEDVGFWCWIVGFFGITVTAGFVVILWPLFAFIYHYIKHGE